MTVLIDRRHAIDRARQTERLFRQHDQALKTLTLLGLRGSNLFDRLVHAGVCFDNLIGDGGIDERTAVTTDLLVHDVNADVIIELLDEADLLADGPRYDEDLNEYGDIA